MEKIRVDVPKLLKGVGSALLVTHNVRTYKLPVKPTRSKILIRRIVFSASVFLLVVQTTFLDNPSALPQVLGLLVCLCSAIANILVGAMLRHINEISEYSDARVLLRWHKWDRHTSEFKFTATRMLFAAPAAWRAWCVGSLFLLAGMRAHLCFKGPLSSS